MNWLSIIERGAGAIIGSGVTALSSKLLGPTINSLKGYQKVAAFCAAGAISGYLTKKATDNLMESINEFHAQWVEMQNMIASGQTEEVEEVAEPDE